VPLDEEVSVGATSSLRTTRSTIEFPLVVGGTGLYFRAALSELGIPPPGRRAHWQAEVDRLGPDGGARTACRARPAAGARLHANDRRRVVRALELAGQGHSLAPAADRLWTDDAAPDDDRRARSPARRARTAASLPVRRDGGRRRGRRGSPGVGVPLSETARKVLGLEEFATPAAADAVERVTLATRRLARYQRKWLRRMPGVVTLDANRHPEEIAADIVELGRTGQHLSRHD
jgi:tRNA dimethylallyltransferase